MAWWKKLQDLLFAGEPSLEGGAVTVEGRTFRPYRAEDDPRRQWPNATCPVCGGLQLKKRMYWHPESLTFRHPECLEDGRKTGAARRA